MTLINKALAWLGGFSVIALILGGAWFLAFGSFALFPKEKVGESVVAKEAKEVKREPKVDVAVTKVRAFKDQPKVKAKLNLPATVIANKDEQVISTARVANTARPHTVTTTINTETGEAQSFVRADPYPWVALESRGSIGVLGGYKYRYDRVAGLSSLSAPVRPIARLVVQHDFLQIKALHVGVSATVDSDGDTFAGVGISYRW